MTIGERIRARRQELGMTQEELAHKVGYKSKVSINKIELSRDLPMKKLKEFALALDLEPETLAGWVGEADQQYYLDKEAQQYTEFLAKNPGHRVLFDASMKVSPDDLDKVAQMLGIFEKKD